MTEIQQPVLTRLEILKMQSALSRVIKEAVRSGKPQYLLVHVDPNDPNRTSMLEFSDRAHARKID